MRSLISLFDFGCCPRRCCYVFVLAERKEEETFARAARRLSLEYAAAARKGSIVTVRLGVPPPPPPPASATADGKGYV